MVQPNLDPQTALLTPPIRHKTNIKAPVDVIVNGDVEQVERRESNATIEVDVCSEFTKLTTATTIAEGNHKLCIVGDSDAHPVIFSLGSDHRLYCAWHVPNGNASWQWRDIGPTISNTVVTSFDVLQDNQTKAVHLAVSLAPNLESSSFSDLYLCPNLSLSMILEKLKEALPWYQAKNNCGKQRIQTLCIAPPPPGLDSDHKVFLVVGTRAHDTTMATNYTVSLDPSIETPWKEHSLPTDRSIVIDHAPGRLVGEYKSGIFSLYRVLDDGEPVPQSAEQGTQVRFKSYEDLTTNLVPDLGEIGGTARSITTCANAAGFTDLFIAGKSGVGYWPSGVVSGRPQSILLKGIDIDQVFAHEANRKITVLATSRQGHLYVVEGIRQPPKKKVNRPTLEPFDWIESGVPIRADVQMMATHRNNRFDCSQLVYVSSDRQIYHIVKDPATKLWNEHVLTIPATDKFAEISSYVTQITLTDSDGETLPANYVVELTSSELCFVTVNDRTQELSPKPIMASTDGSGQIRIVTQVGPSLGAPTFTLHLKSSTSNASIHIDPAQRVLRKLLSVTSGSQIRNAKTTTGKAVFKDGQLTEEDANRIADSLKSLPQVLGTADKDCLQRLGPGLNVSTASAISTSGSLSGNTAQSKESNSAPQKGIIEKVFDGIGDVLEAVVRGIVKVARFVWEIVEEVVFFVLEIGKKVFKFVCNTVGPIVRGFANFIAETTGWNGLNTFLDWMGTVFDGENTIKTQTVLVNFVTKGSNLMADAWVSNRPYIDYLIENLRDSIDIPDKRESPPPRESGGGFFATLKKFLGKMFDIIFNNPVVHGILNLVKRLWNAIVEESGIEIPSMQPIYNIFTELASRIGNDLGEQFERLLVDIMSKFSDMLSGKMDLGDTLKTLLGDGFWTLFDILQSFVVHTYDAIPKFIKEVIVYLNGEWKVPLITRLWKFMTDTPLTIMNVLTYPLAFVLNLFTVMMHGKPAFEVWPDPSTFLPPVHKLTAKVPQSNQTTVPILTSDHWSPNLYTTSQIQAKNFAFTTLKVQAEEDEKHGIAIKNVAKQGSSIIADGHSQSLASEDTILAVHSSFIANNAAPGKHYGPVANSSPNVDTFMFNKLDRLNSRPNIGQTAVTQLSDDGHEGREQQHHEPTKEEWDALRIYRITDCACGAASTVAGLIVSFLEFRYIVEGIGAHQVSEAAKAQEAALATEFQDSANLFDYSEAEVKALAKARSAGLNAQALDRQAATKEKHHTAENWTILMRSLTLISHIISTVFTFRSPLHIRMTMGSMKLVGTIFNFVAVVYHKKEMFSASTRLMAIGNLVGFTGAGVYEYFSTPSDKRTGWDRWRVGGDSAEGLGGVINLAGPNFIKPEKGKLAIALLGLDVAASIGSLSAMSRLLAGYCDSNEKTWHDAVEERE